MSDSDPLERRRARDRARSRRRAGERAAAWPSACHAAGVLPRTAARPAPSARSGSAPRPAPAMRGCAPRGGPGAAASPARPSGNAAAGRPPSGSPGASAPDAASIRRRTAAASARPAWPGAARPTGSATGRPGHWVLTYGGRDPGRKRAGARAANRKRRATRLAEGRCTRCGHRRPVEDSTVCETCRMERRAAERAIYEARRSAGLCGRCGGPTTDGGSRCAPCAILEAGRGNRDRRNRQARERYSRRRSAGRCVDCNLPSQGAARCSPCAKRSHERSGHFRGMPLYPPRYTVIELATGACHGTYDSMADVALCLAFAKLSRRRGRGDRRRAAACWHGGVGMTRPPDGVASLSPSPRGGTGGRE